MIKGKSVPPSPSQMLTSSILIQTDDGRKFDYSIQHNRIMHDPYEYSHLHYHRKSTIKPILAGIMTIAIFSYLLISENMGFSSLSLATTATNGKYLGRRPNLGSSNYNNSSSSYVENNYDEATGAEEEDALSLLDDDANDDELRGTYDDDDDDASQVVGIVGDHVENKVKTTKIRDGDNNEWRDTENENARDDTSDQRASLSSENKEINNRTMDNSNDGWRAGSSSKGNDDALDTIDDNTSFENEGNNLMRDGKDGWREEPDEEDDDAQDVDGSVVSFDKENDVGQFRDINLDNYAQEANTGVSEDNNETEQTGNNNDGKWVGDGWGKTNGRVDDVDIDTTAGSLKNKGDLQFRGSKDTTRETEHNDAQSSKDRASVDHKKDKGW